MFALTKSEGTLADGAYATYGRDGIPVVQFFVDEDDAIRYNVYLEAFDQGLYVTPVKGEEQINKLCDLLGYAYSIVEPGELLIPRESDL
jgi:hypothetical protein